MASTHPNAEAHAIDLDARVREMESRIAGLEDLLGDSHRLMTLGTILGSIAHELNNILTPVMSYAELARMHPSDTELRDRALARIAGGVARASAITTAILRFAEPRQESGGNESCSVRDAIRQALDCLARPPESDGIIVDVQVSADLRAGMGATVLQHVILNLVLNARRAMRNSGGELTISGASCRAEECWVAPEGFESAKFRMAGDDVQNCSTWNNSQESMRAGQGVREPQEYTGSDTSDNIRTRTSQEQSFVRIDVSDTGPGIDPAIFGRLFTAFGTARGRGGRGAGLGLSICRRLVEEVGGRIGVWSKVGAGTVFRIVAPTPGADHPPMPREA